MKKLLLTILTLVAIGSLIAIIISLSAPKQEQTEPVLGADIPTVVALYTDSLDSKMTDSDTSFTLIRGTDKQGRGLSGFYGFVIDEGSSIEEFMTANCTTATNTTCTVVARGIDVVDGKTEVTALKQEHRRGALVKITNFPQIAILSRILNGKESASSTFSFGGGTTAQDKIIKADNGTANLPFIRYNEALTKWQYSDDGLNTITFVTSSAGGLSASSTGAAFIIDSKIGVYTSSTASSNGGFMSIADQSSGESRIYFDSPLFRSTAGSWSGPQTFSSLVGTSTNDNLQITGTPDSDNDAVNLGSVRELASQGYATGTAGGDINIGDALYMSSTSSLFLTDADSATSSYKFVGISLSTASSTDEVTFVKPGGIADNLTGLTAGDWYYLSNTAGSLASSPGTLPVRVGIALSANRLLITKPDFTARKSGSVTSVTGSPTTITTGFPVTRVDLVCGPDGGENLQNTANDTTPSRGSWYRNSDGTFSQYSIGYGADAENWNYSNIWACFWEESTNFFGIKVSSTANGFTLEDELSSSGRRVEWVAEYDGTLINNIYD